jgi:hypothetical protein
MLRPYEYICKTGMHPEALPRFRKKIGGRASGSALLGRAWERVETNQKS